MNTNKGTSDELKKDLSTLRMEIDNLESMTVQQARAAYHKADPENREQVANFTAAFQELGNCYQRVLKH